VLIQLPRLSPVVPLGTAGRNIADGWVSRAGLSRCFYLRLEEPIPTDHLLRMIDSHVDFRFVREQLQDF